MPMFYFDIDDGAHVLTDEQGQWFPTVQAAQREATEAIFRIIRETGEKHISLTVRDGNGNTLAEAYGELRIEANRRV